MSPEINGNPPSVTKRKKNRERKAQQSTTEVMHNFDLNMPSCNYFPISQQTYPNFSIPEMPTPYYSFMNCANSGEPMSLPIYPMNYPGYTCSGSVMGSIGNISRHSTLSNHTFNIASEPPDYMSLPVANVDANEESKRRYSDPGLPNDSDSESNSCDERMVQQLTQQIQYLKESNNRLSREVMELRIELNLMKQQQATKHYDREYEPGMLADVIREVREAARVREDALLARVKHIMEEKHLSVNQLSLATEKNRNNDRIAKLEEQLKSLTVSKNSRSDHSSSTFNSLPSVTDDNLKTAQQLLDLRREASELRKELQDTHAKRLEADQKVFELSQMLTRKESSKADLTDTYATVTTPISSLPKAVLSGPVTSL